MTDTSEGDDGVETQRAQQWHDRMVETDPGHENVSSCWCCCIDCDPGWGGGNPHYAAAVREWPRR